MASIYDIAKIASGDPLGAAADAAKEADIIFQQYQNQKERVEEIRSKGIKIIKTIKVKEDIL